MESTAATALESSYRATEILKIPLSIPMAAKNPDVKIRVVVFTCYEGKSVSARVAKPVMYPSMGVAFQHPIVTSMS